MRITNKMMTNTALANINRNKIKLNQTSNQKATGLKIQRASEDPIVAVRALRFRSNLSQLNQYYEKNIPDAYSWMSVTESALQSINDRLGEMNTACIDAANGTKSVQDCLAIAEKLHQLSEEIYQQGNTDYAGRYVFTGYKTDTPLVFQNSQSELTYEITQNLSGSNFESYSYIKDSLSTTNFNSDDGTYPMPTIGNTHRMRLAYKDVDDNDELKIFYRNSDANSALAALTSAEITLTNAERKVAVAGNEEAKALTDLYDMFNLSEPEKSQLKGYIDTYKASGGTPADLIQLESDINGMASVTANYSSTDITNQINAKVPVFDAAKAANAAAQSEYSAASATHAAAQSAYDATYIEITPINTVSANDDDAYDVDPYEVRLIKETGELIFGDKIYEEMRYSSNIDITYTKSSFDKDDLRPEHYFNCNVTDYSENPPKEVKYEKEDQVIQYEINFGQKLTVNTQADTAFNHDIGRDVDELLRSVQDAIAINDKIESVKKMIEDPMYASDKDALTGMLERLEVERSLTEDLMYKNFQQKVTTTNKYQDKVNIAESDLGSRWNRLELTENRLSSQQVDFEELLSNNEEADLADVLVRYASLDALYTSSLSAASKVVKNTLLDFI